MTVESGGEPSELEWRDIAFAWKVCRHVRSNAIVFAKGRRDRRDRRRADEPGRLGPAGGREVPRRLRRGGRRACSNGSVVASDAFFPFADGPQAAIEAGARTVVQPGGSKRDVEVIEAVEKAGVTMVFTGRRHFRH